MRTGLKFSYKSVEKRLRPGGGAETAPWRGSGVQQIEAITESPQQQVCSHDLLGVILASTNDALSTARLALAKGGDGNCRKEALARVLLYLTCSGLLDNMIMLQHNHQTNSMHIKPPNEVV